MSLARTSNLTYYGDVIMYGNSTEPAEIVLNSNISFYDILKNKNTNCEIRAWVILDSSLTDYYSPILCIMMRRVYEIIS